MFALTVNVIRVVLVAPYLSVAVRVTVVDPAVVGVPEIVHVAALYVRPAGNAEVVMVSES